MDACIFFLYQKSLSRNQYKEINHYAKPGWISHRNHVLSTQCVKVMFAHFNIIIREKDGSEIISGLFKFLEILFDRVPLFSKVGSVLYRGASAASSRPFPP